MKAHFKYETKIFQVQEAFQTQNANIFTEIHNTFLTKMLNTVLQPRILSYLSYGLQGKHGFNERK